MIPEPELPWPDADIVPRTSRDIQPSPDPLPLREVSGSPAPEPDQSDAVPAVPRRPETPIDPAHPAFQRALEILRSDSPPGSTPSGDPAPKPGTVTALRQPNDPLPARMLNEFVYCPRLFYYEFVEGVFVDNADTARGNAIHQRVDQGKGDLPPAAAPQPNPGLPTGATSPAPPVPDGKRPRRAKAPAPPADTSATPPAAAGEEIIHSRSVTLGSDRLGVIAKMDLVEVRTLPTPAPAPPMPPGETGDLFAAAAAAAARNQVAHAAEVVPVDYKAGAPRAGAEANELWPTDRMQLGLQCLILRDNGYACREGVIYYRATKQRVRLELTPELESWVIDQIDAARRCTSGPIPPPLVGSPKCVRCSLAPICLPDETTLLTKGIASEPAGSTADAAAPAGPAGPRPGAPATPRRLIAARDETRALYLNTPGLRVGRRDETLTVKEEDRVIDDVRLMDLSHVALFGNIQITTQAIQALCDAEIPLTYFSMGGWFYGLTRGHGLKNVFLRIEQFRRAPDAAFALDLARRFIHGKIRNHRTLLMRNHVEAPDATLTRLKFAAQDALRATSLEELLGIEGSAAAAYFEEFNGMLKAGQPDDDLDFGPGSATPAPASKGGAAQLTFNFTHRNRRPPTDPVNALLGLAYSLLAKDCTLACLAVGFDPYVGFYHQPRFGRPALSLDLMEEFRPLIAESAVLSAINNRVITPDDFVRAGAAVNLTPAGRKRFFQTYEQRMNGLLTHPLFDYKVSYRRALELQARLLAKCLTGEIPEYLPLLTR